MQSKGMRNSGAGSTVKARELPCPSARETCVANRVEVTKVVSRLARGGGGCPTVQAKTARPTRPVSNKIPRTVPRKHLAHCNQSMTPTGGLQPGEVTTPQCLGAGHGG